MIKMKFIEKLTESEHLALEEAYKNPPSFRCRQRAHALRLNNRGYTAAKLCPFFDNQQETICHWLDNASIHHSLIFEQRKDYWMARGVCLHYLPTYSPELNLIDFQPPVQLQDNHH